MGLLAATIVIVALRIHGQGPPRGMRIVGGVGLNAFLLGAHEPVSETASRAFPAPRIVAASTIHSVVDRLALPGPVER